MVKSLLGAVVSAADQTYDGSEKTPAVTVTLNGETIPPAGYDVEYFGNTNAGQATVTVTGRNGYSGTATGHFTINKAAGSVTTAPAANSLVYTGGSQYLVTAGSGTGTIYYRSKLSTDSSWSSWSTVRPSGEAAGTYNVEYYASESTNYQVTLPVSIEVTIVNLTVAPANINLAYDGSGSATITVTANTDWIVE